MVSQIEQLFRGCIQKENIFRQNDHTEASFKRLFRRMQKAGEILEVASVYGSRSLNSHINATCQDSACFNSIQYSVRDFRSKPRFDMIFYSLRKNTATPRNTLLEDLCYCRMLLKPGAFLFLVLDGQRTSQTESSWLIRSGFTNATTQKMGNGFFLIGGQRPTYTF